MPRKKGGCAAPGVVAYSAPAGADLRSTTVRGMELMGSIEDRLTKLGVTLPKPAAAVANYLPFLRNGSQLFISGQLAFGLDGTLDAAHRGKLGGSVARDAGRAAARLSFINVLAQAKAALGELDRIGRCVRLGGFINAEPGFTDLPAVMNGASDLAVEALGDKGRHVRTTVGVASLPLGCAVEVEALFEVE